MPPNSGFLPTTLQGWLTIIVMVVGFPWAFWKGYSSFIEKLNGIGNRVATLETNDAHRGGRMVEFERAIDRGVSETGGIRDRLSRVEKASENTNDLLTDMKLEILGALGDLKTNALREDGKTRERLVRLETVSMIERKLGRSIADIMEETT